MKLPAYTLAEIAEALGAQLRGDPNRQVSGLQTLKLAGSTQLSFLANPAYRKDLPDTQAGAVLLQERELEDCPCDALVLDNPYLAYAQLSHWFDARPVCDQGIHPTAIVAATAQVAASASVGAYSVIEADVVIAEGVQIGPHSVIGAGSTIGKDSKLAANVTLYHQVTVGERALIHSSAVIGADGFGFANDQGRWSRIAQLGRVIIGDDVEVGASTTIDRGALGDTCIGNGVKLDNQVQVAHNVVIGQDSALAACAGIAGSTTIGRRCTLAGMVGVSGHLNLADDVHITAMSLVSKSLPHAGIYSSSAGGVVPQNTWRRNVVRFRQLDALATRLGAVEKSLEALQNNSEPDVD